MASSLARTLANDAARLPTWSPATADRCGWIGRIIVRAMSTRAKIRARVTPRLPAGEQYVVGFPAVGGLTPRLAHRYRVVVVTDVRVHLFAAGWWKIGDSRRLISSLPPGTIIESKRSFIYEEIVIGPERLWVLPPYHEELSEAIAATSAFGTQQSPFGRPSTDD